MHCVVSNNAPRWIMPGSWIVAQTGISPIVYFCFSILKAAGDGEAQSVLEQLKKMQATINQGRCINRGMNWQKMSVEAVGWIKTLPPTIW